MLRSIDPPKSGGSRIRLAACCALLLGLACQDRPPEESQRPNILLISIDSLRADHVGAYGYPRPTSPNLDRLAREGVLFETVVASSSWTLPTHAALFTGLPDPLHGLNRPTQRLSSARRTLAEALASEGYETAAIWSGPLLNPRFGLDQGFDHYVAHDGPVGDAFGAEPNWNALHRRSHNDVTGPDVLARADELLAELPEPWFLFVHLWDPHYDYLAPDDFVERFSRPSDSQFDGTRLARRVGGQRPLVGADRQRMIDLYDAEVSWTDSQVGDLLTLVDRHSVGRANLVAVTADHGEEFYEHGSYGHKQNLFEESIRVPLILHGPRVEPRGRRISEPVRSIDVAPTLLDLVGAPQLPEAWGRSLSPLFDPSARSTAADQLAVSELAFDDFEMLAVRTVDWKALFDSRLGRVVALYDLQADPLEQNSVLAVDQPLADRALAVVAKVRQRLVREQRQLLRPSLGSETLPAELEAELRSLGYLASTDRPASIWLSPDPVPTCGGQHGSTVVHWHHEDPAVETIEVRVGPPHDTVFATQTPVGSQEAEGWVHDGMVFLLVDPSTERELGRVVASVNPKACPGD